MGEHAEDTIGWILEGYGHMTGGGHKKAMEPIAPGTWRTREGVIVKITDMFDQHLMHTLAMLERNAKDLHWKTFNDLCTAENFVQGEHALLAIEYEQRQLMETSPLEFAHRAYWEMLAEAEKRGLLPHFKVVGGRKTICSIE